MSHYNFDPNPHQLPRPRIVVHDHDVLSGRGVNIALHPGNQRLRTLVTTRADDSFCTSYSATEKRAVAEEILKHIKQLDPPGRFLKRDARCQGSRGLAGPWEELTDREAVKKICQALRDCNRLDRQGYAAGVAMPSDVVQAAEDLKNAGLTGKQHAARAAAEVAAAQAAATIPNCKRDWGRLSPSVENAAEWLKKQRTDDNTTVTPSTSGSDTANGEHPSYDPAATDGHSAFESFSLPVQYASAPSPVYAPTPFEGYAPPTSKSYESSQSTDFSQPSALSHFPTAQPSEAYQIATAYQLPSSPTPFQQNSSPVPYEHTGARTPAPVASDPTNPISPDQSNPSFGFGQAQSHPGARQQMPQGQQLYPPDHSQGLAHAIALPLYPTYTETASHHPAPQAQGYATGLASNNAPPPYAHLAAPMDGGGGYLMNVYQQASARTYQHPLSEKSGADVSPAPLFHTGVPQSFHVAPGTAFQVTPGQAYHSAPVPDYVSAQVSDYQNQPDFQGTTSQSFQGVAGRMAHHQSHSSPESIYPSNSNPSPFHPLMENAHSYQQSTEGKLRGVPTPIAPKGTESAYSSSDSDHQHTVELDLHRGGLPAAPKGSEATFSSESTDFECFPVSAAEYHNTSSSAYSDPKDAQSGPMYDHRHTSTASVGTDLLISAAYQTNANSSQEIETGGNSSVSSANKWDGETLGL